MPKMTKAGCLGALENYADACKRIAALEKKMNAEIEPHKLVYDEATKPILDKFSTKFNALYSERDAAEAEALEYLEEKVRARTPFVIESDNAVGEVSKKDGSRKIDVEKFLQKAKDKGAAAWDCVTVAVAKAVKLLGDTAIDEISTKGETYAANVKLK